MVEANGSRRSTQARQVVILLSVGLAIITYVQRVAISQAAPLIQADLGLTKVQMGLVFSAFSLGYALLEIPWGLAGDRWGARWVLTGIVAAWSMLTAATGWAWNLAALIGMRGLFGTFQAGCFPTIARMYANWLPESERVHAQGILWLSARWGGAAAPLLVALLLGSMNWRQAFEVFGLAGLLWAVLFFWWYRDYPRDHWAVNQVELQRIAGDFRPTQEQGKIPWRRFFRSRAVWLLCGQYMCLNFGWTFYITWLPTYLVEARGVALQESAWLAALPLFFGGLGSLACGFLSSALDRLTGSVTVTRRVLTVTGFIGAAACFVLSIHIQSPVWAMVALGIASFSNDLVMPISWATCMDVGGRVCGTLSATMNMMGGFVAASAPAAIAMILKGSNDNWALAFYVSAAVYLMGAMAWLALDPAERIDAGEGA
ncbi:MAG: MFS transporter [Thermoguttaceae bacterium]